MPHAKYCLWIVLVATFGLNYVSICSPVGESETSSVQNEESLVPVENQASADVKDGPFFFELPPFMQAGKPFIGGSASMVGDIGTLFSTNNATLITTSNGDSPAISSLNSVSSYSIVPINETTGDTQELPDGSTNTWLNNLAGFAVTAQEQVTAFGQGDNVTYINYGTSQIAGLGNSLVEGVTQNSAAPGSGWKSPEENQELSQMAHH